MCTSHKAAINMHLFYLFILFWDKNFWNLCFGKSARGVPLITYCIYHIRIYCITVTVY
jgi:hypothetical protein